MFSWFFGKNCSEEQCKVIKRRKAEAESSTDTESICSPESTDSESERKISGKKQQVSLDSNFGYIGLHNFIEKKNEEMYKRQ